MSAERGETSLTGLLLAAVLLVAVLGMSLGTLDGISAVVADGNRRTDAQDTARRSVDAMSRALRNLASPSTERPESVDQATARSLVFQTVDAGVTNSGQNVARTKRVRYCLDDAQRILEQTQTWTTPGTPGVPSVSGCPATGWTRTHSLVQHVANGDIPVFSYDAATSSEITAIHVELLIDTDLKRPPGATRLASGVFLRNQNRRPVASFVASAVAGRVVLNGSGSSDPEGQPLEYEWFDGATALGVGVTYRLTVPSGSGHSFRLRVSDPAGLTATSAAQAVTG